MATENKDFKVKNGLIVGGTGVFNGTVTVATPTANDHAATKEYVDQNAGGGGSSLTVSDTPPQNPSQGDLWFNSLDGSTYVYYDSFWVENTSAYAGPEGPAGIVNATSPLSFNEETSVLSIDLSGYATTTQLGNKIDSSEKGANNGVATLDENGDVPASQLGNVPSVDLTGYATEGYVTSAITSLIDSAPSTLNTLNELAAALNDDANFATTISSSLANKLEQSDLQPLEQALEDKIISDIMGVY